MEEDSDNEEVLNEAPEDGEPANNYNHKLDKIKNSSYIQ